ncbi:MAG: hypothetical protein GX139_05710 [Armatimonadetes bacterium]|jgi:hypothetical protein|nr:hypothetical protein [Armatimonadota bacterium]
MLKKALKILLIILIGGVLIATLLYWFVCNHVQAMFSIRPGGRDVSVKVNGKPAKPRHISSLSDSNLYIIWLKPGQHRIIVDKPGYISQRHTLNILEVKKGGGEAYPDFPPLQPVDHQQNREKR